MGSLPVVRINPNLRLDGDLTMVDLDEDVENGPLVTMARVEVRGDALVGHGTVIAIHDYERAAYIWVNWEELRLDDTAGRNSPR